VLLRTIVRPTARGILFFAGARQGSPPTSRTFFPGTRPPWNGQPNQVRCYEVNVTTPSPSRQPQPPFWGPIPGKRAVGPPSVTPVHCVRSA